MKRILIVEDDEGIQYGWKLQLEEFPVIIYTATDLLIGEVLYNSLRPTLDLVVMDGCIGENSYNTGPLIKLIHQTFSGPVLAASSSEKVRKQMMRDGCTFECPKFEVVKRIVPLLVPKHHPAHI